MENSEIVEIGTYEFTNEDGSKEQYDAIVVPLLLADELRKFLNDRGVEPLTSWNQAFQDRHFEMLAPKGLAEVRELAVAFRQLCGQ